MLRGGAQILHGCKLSTRCSQFFPMDFALAALLFACGNLGLTLVLAFVLLRVRNYSAAATVKHRFDEIEAVLEAHGQWWKKLNANVASLRATQKRAEPDESHESNGSTDGTFAMRTGETPEQWKTRMRTALATGQIKPPR